MLKEFDLTEIIDEDFDEVEVFLNYADPDQDIPPDEIRILVDKALEEYSFEEILEENERSEEDVLEFLYELGFIGLPEVLEYEEVQDREETAED